MINWNDSMKNEVLPRVKEENNTRYTLKRRKANWTGHTLRRNCLLQHVIEEEMEGTRRRGRIRKRILDDRNETRDNLKLKRMHFIWRCMYCASYCNVYTNQRDAQILVNNLYFFVKWPYMFRTNDSPKHVKPFNEKIKIIHKNLCTSLVCLHIAIWCTVHTTSNRID